MLDNDPGKESQVSRLYSWLLNAVYLSLLLASSPLLLWSAIRHGKYRDGFAEKLLGRVPRRLDDRPCVWLHAVSVGEVNLLGTLISEMNLRHPDWQIVISTTTQTGYDLARRKYADRTVFYCPLDFSWAVHAAMRRVRPDILVLAELELWPNLIRAAKTQAVCVAVINGRMGDSSFRGYRRLRWLVAPLLRQVDLIASQNEETAKRFAKLGARPRTLQVTGSLKYDGAETNRDNPRSVQLCKLTEFGEQDCVFLAGSTQQPEESYALEIFQSLATEHPRLRLVLVPRHPQRFDEVAQMLDRSGLSWQRRSELERSELRRVSRCDTASRAATQHTATTPTILLVDSIGELGAWWGTATIGFVGGTFGSRGGQNMIEPAAYGVATCFGPNTWNFRDIVAGLLAADAAVVVRNQGELAAFVRRALEDAPWREQLGDRARRFVATQQGATTRTVQLLESLLPPVRSTIKPASAA